MLSEVLPIADYDRLTASEILKVLKQLSPRDLAVVAEHERSTKARVTILNRLARLGVSGDGDLVVDLRDDPAGSCLLCGVEADSQASFAAHLERVHGLRDDPGFESTLPKKLFAPVVQSRSEKESVLQLPVLKRVPAPPAEPELDPEMASLEAEFAHFGPLADARAPIVPVGPVTPVASMDRLDPASVSKRHKVVHSGWPAIACLWVSLMLLIVGVLLLIG